MRHLFVAAARTTGANTFAVSAGLLTRPCCLAPAILSLTGGSAAGLSQVFGAHHTAWTALSGVLLTASIWMNVRLQARPWNKGLAVAVALLAFMFMAKGPGIVASGPSAQERRTVTQECTLKVDGMACGACSNRVEKVARRVEGVRDASVSHEQGMARITYDPAKTNPAAIARAITENTGFKSDVKK